jgi:hypothetical protein
MRSRSFVVPLLILLAGFVLGADPANAAKVRSYHDPEFDFSKVKTYQFKVDQAKRNESLDGRIVAEIRAQLAKKGLRELPADSSDSPDVFVGYAVGTVDTLSPGFIPVAGWYGTLWAVPGAYSAITGGLLVEMGDPATGKEIWAASYVMKGNNPQAIQYMASQVEKAVRGALGKYPPKK